MKPVVMNYVQGISSSETSSDEETDHDQDQEQDDDDDSAKRSYECTFCRRGFTNAQALGGHMNIHRKDKAKAKKLLGTPNNNSSPSLQNKYTHDEESMASPLIPQISTQTPNCYTTIFQPSSAADNYYPIINPPAAAYAFQYEFLSTTRYHQSLGTNQDLLGPNLSLQIGQSHHLVNTDQVRRGIHQRDGDVVDLELRLGHDPCSNY